MPRIHLILAFLLGSFGVKSQTPISKYITEGNTLFNKGDYYYALDFYDKAYQIDSNSVELIWQMAETYRAYKDYRKAEEFYDKCYRKEEALLYPTSILQLGLMQKMNGKYVLALETFKMAKKKYANDKKSYNYIKSKKEIESCLYAQINETGTGIKVEQLASSINSKNSEFGHTFSPDNRLIFSSLKGDLINEDEEVYSKEYRTKLYIQNLSDSSARPELIKELSFQGMNTGNGSFSADGRRFYFSLCSEKDAKNDCVIMVARYENNSWSDIDSLGEIINAKGANSTMPLIQMIGQQEFLFFSSNRQNSKGAMDLYYSLVTKGNQYSEPKNISALNSIDSELSPFFDTKKNRLYFSSNWHDGFGGYDIFYSSFKDNQFMTPVNLGKPYNSAANDLYYFEKNDTAYVTSNRFGVNYSKNPTCCSDIFRFSSPIIPIKIDSFILKKESLEELNRRLPVTLYFHNDEPNPRSLDTVTKVNYLNGYVEYRAMLEKYQTEYSKGLSGQTAENAKEDIESFFIEYVDQGVKNLYLFRDLLLEELKKGSRIKVTIKGFASPLAKSDYNIKLTKRRISSLQNYLLSYENGVFATYFQNTSETGGKLIFEEVPFGEDKSDKLVSDNLNDKKNSVYSRSAALERKIEIQSVSYLDSNASIKKNSETTVVLPNTDKPTFDTTVVDLGQISKTEKVTARYRITNSTKEVQTIENLRVPCNCSEGKVGKKELKPGESTEIEFIFDPSDYKGKIVKSIYVKLSSFTEEIRLILLANVLDE